MGGVDKPPKVSVSFLIRNVRATELALVREPWGDQFQLGAGACLEVVGSGPTAGVLEVEVGADRVTVWAWNDADLKVFQDGVEVHGT